MVICDEGHLMRNAKSGVSTTMSQIKTVRRVVLSGTPLQNNLKEYHVMVDFVKPGLLGTAQEFQRNFVDPIYNGQCVDSTKDDIRLMRRRSHVSSVYTPNERQGTCRYCSVEFGVRHSHGES
jgi:transcriptional regulator ATRX